jgi:alpha-mannosidase
VRSEATVTHWRKRLAFVADLPALGHRVHFITPNSRIAGTPCVASDTMLENVHFRLELDVRSGAIARLVDKRAGREVFAAPAARAVVINDKSDTWSHGTVRYHGIAGEFGQATCRLVEHGPVRSVIRAESRFGESLVFQEFSLSPLHDRIVVRVGVDWREKQRLLKLRFPVAVRDPQATFEIPYGHFVRVAGGDEEPGQAWIDVTGRTDDDRRYGVAILNDAKYSYDVLANDIGLTVLRSPIFSHHDPYVPREGERYVYLDQGVQRFTYVLIPHAGPWQDAGIARAALELLQSPVAMFESAHAGPLPLRASAGSIEPANVTLTVLKHAEDGSGDLVVRCVETSGRRTDATIALAGWGETIRAAFGPSEIKTFRVPRDGEPFETDLLERAI